MPSLDFEKQLAGVTDQWLWEFLCRQQEMTQEEIVFVKTTPFPKLMAATRQNLANHGMSERWVPLFERAFRYAQTSS